MPTMHATRVESELQMTTASPAIQLNLCLDTEDIKTPALSFDEIYELIAAFISWYKLTCPIDVDVMITTPETIAEYNRQTREMDRPTDVLSFPLDFSEVAEQGSHEVVKQLNAMQTRAHLGQIVLCQDIAAQQSETFGHSVDDEMRLLIVHSLFHLLGYDHIHEADAAVMQAQEDAFLEYYNGVSKRTATPLTFLLPNCREERS